MSLLVAPWPGPYGGVPPWNEAAPGRFPEAFARALEQERSEVDAIARNTAPPTFDNTIAPLEAAGRARDWVTRMFLVLRENISTSEIRAIDLEWQPKLAAADDAVVFNSGLFQRIDAVQASLTGAGLSPEQARLTRITQEAFIRKGARLSDAEKTRLGDLNQALEALYSEFRAKVLADEDTWTVLDGEDDLVGLPASRDLRRQGGCRRARLGCPRGGCEHALQRGPIPDLFSEPGPARACLAALQEPRRQRRRPRHHTRHHRHRRAPRRARGPAGVRKPCALAAVGHDGPDAGTGPRPDAAGLESRRRQSRRGGRPDAVDRGRRRDDRRHRAVGLPLLRREGPTDEIRSRSIRAQAVLRAQQHGRGGALVCRTAIRPALFRDHPGRSPCSIPMSGCSR